MRNVAANDYQDVPRAVLPVGTDYPDGFVLDWHSHRRAQFLYSATGVMVLETHDGTWTVPTDLAVLIPAGVRHLMRTSEVTTRSLYVQPAAVPWWPDRCTVVQVTPLLRELLLVAVDFESDYDLSGRAGAVAALLLHEIAALTPLSMHVSLPVAVDLAALCRDYLAMPDVRVGNAQWASRVGLGERAFSRRFRTEMGVSPAAWRRRACLLAAIPLLRGASVTEVAGRLGYATPAAFTSAFSTEFGMPPSRVSAQIR